MSKYRAWPFLAVAAAAPLAGAFRRGSRAARADDITVEDFYEDGRIVHRLGDYYVVQHTDDYWEGPLRVGPDDSDPLPMGPGETYVQALRRLAGKNN